MPLSDSFPLKGIIGVIANNASELDQAVHRKLQCVEVRADLLLEQGMQLDALMLLIGDVRKLGLGCLVTVRHPSHGGKFTGSEAERVAINCKALAAGADIVDVEWDSEAAVSLLQQGAPLVLSYHNFSAMPDNQKLAELTQQIIEMQPLAVKVVPTAGSLEDACAMLRWVEQGAGHSVRRIGFAMGSAGAFSRILTTAFGGAVSYGSFGEAVAPGQVDLDHMLNRYRINEHTAGTQLVAVVGSMAYCDRKVAELNQQYATDRINQVAIGFDSRDKTTLETHRRLLRLVDVVDESR